MPRSRKIMSIALLGATALAVPAIAAGNGGQGHTAVVKNDNDAGPGSFRAAVAEANAQSQVKNIVFARHINVVRLASPVVYTGGQSLSIYGGGATLKPTAVNAGPLFTDQNGADLNVAGLSFAGSHDIGLKVNVPATRGGVVRVGLHNLVVKNNAQEGVLIDDSASAPAGVRLHLDRVVVRENGTPEATVGNPNDDRDGMRVNETGTGGINATIIHSTVNANIYDGVELDEQGPGSALAYVRATTFNDNGVSGNDDVEDGFDIDEAGTGDLVAELYGVTANGNKDEGIDLDEGTDDDATDDDAGSIVLIGRGVTANGNADEGMKASEVGDGALTVRVSGLALKNNGDDGTQLEEMGDGNANVSLNGVRAIDNARDGVKVDEVDGGDLIARLIGVVSKGNDDGDGVQLEEKDHGNLSAVFLGGNLSENVKSGVKAVENDEGDFSLVLKGAKATQNDIGVEAEQDGAGSGTLEIRDSNVSGNGTDKDLSGVSEV